VRPLPWKTPPLLIQPVLIACILAGAALLRLWRVGHGLPDFLEEAIPFRLALGMRSPDSPSVDWNPHDFHYPSLSIYLHFMVQQVLFALGSMWGTYASWADYLLAYYVDPTPMVLAARAVGIAFDVATVFAAIRIGNRLLPGAGIVAGLVLAFAPAMIWTSRSIFTDTLMTTLALWALERMLAGHAEKNPRHFLVAAVLVGLAAGTKYPAAALLVPLGWLLWHHDPERRPRERARAIAVLAAVAFGVFLVTTPYALLDPAAFARDFLFESHHAADGHLGSVGAPSFGYHAGLLGRDLGVVGAILFLLSPVVAWLDERRREPIVALWLAALVFGVPISLARIDAERYVLPVLAIASVLAPIALLTGLKPFHRGARVGFASILVALLGAPLVVAGLRAASLGSDTTQLQARRWVEKFLRPTELLVQEGYSARLPTAAQAEIVRESAEYRLASKGWREKLDGITTYRVVPLPLSVSGRLTVTVQPVGAGAEELPVVEHADQLNQVFYDARLFAGVDYFMTSSAVRGRYERDGKRFPTQAGFYRLLDNAAEVVARFKSRGDVEGPEIVVYRLGSRYRAGIEMRGALDSLWWTASIMREFRERAGTLLVPRAPAPPLDGPDGGMVAGDSAASAPGAMLAGGRDVVVATPVRARRDSADASLAAEAAAGDDSLSLALAAAERARARAALDSARTRAWVGALRPLYDARIRTFVDRMAVELGQSRRWDPALRLAIATHVMDPESPEACAILSVCARNAGRLDRARGAIETTLAANRDAMDDPALRLEYARVLEGLGDREGWRRELETLAAAIDPAAPVAVEARRLLAASPPAP
jgi:hypothetical protein